MASTLTSSAIQKARDHRGLVLPVAIILSLLVLLVPLPTSVLDLLLIINLTLSVVILVTTIYVKSPLEFSAFPSILLAVTLFRLVLNVATTRLVLSGGGLESSAGEVVRAFGNLVTAGSVAVGAVIFAIIFVIQFVVITKGGSRVSEVAARFQLDAMPGKQMAIDAELNQGLITQQQARERRDAVAREADFFAAMEGAGKFVRGDAIAALLITLVNIIGGLAIGLSNNMDLSQALTSYTKLTIGDGLVSQLPAFIIALAAGLIVTRSSGESNLGEDVLNQLIARPKSLLVAVGFLAVLALTGLPKIPLLIMAACCGGLAYVLTRGEETPEVMEEADEEAAESGEQGVEKLLALETIEVELGHGLHRLADVKRGGDLLDRLAQVRRQIAVELGLLVPPVRIADSPQLGVNDYAIRLRGQVVACGVVYPDQFLAVDEGEADAPILAAEETAEPACGRLAYWITDAQGSEADQLHYRVFDAPAVLVNHLAEVIRTHASELLSRQAVKELLDNLHQRSGAVVDEVVGKLMQPGEIQKVLQSLLRERVPIRDLETILETVGDYASRTKDADLLTEYVRVALARTICKQHVDDRDRLPCLALSESVETLVRGHIERGDRGTIYTMPPATAQRISQDVWDEAQRQCIDGRLPVVLVAAPIRLAVRRMIEPIAPQVAVLSVAEVTGDVAPDVVGVVGEEAGPIGARDLVEDRYESSDV